MAERSGMNEWSALLEETRQALATLRAEDLEELAARAECMLSATLGDDWIRQRIPAPRRQELLDVTRQHRLLADLLRASGSSLAVLRGNQIDSCDRGRFRERGPRWVR